MSKDFSLTCSCCESELFTYNLTHNLANMARMAGVYAPIWHPNDPPYPRYEKAIDLIAILDHGIKKMEANPEYYKKFNPLNKWGSYDGLLKALNAIKHACFQHQNARPEASI